MTTANLGSRLQSRIGYVHWTVEAEPADIDRNLERSRGLATVIEKLFEMFNRHHQAATWAVGDPAQSAIAELVAASETKHSLALLGDRFWFWKTSCRTRFARELARRASQARAAGIETVTLVPRVASIAEHMDLVVKHDIHAVVSTSDETASTISPRAMHYGVWEFAVKARLPQRRTWLPSSWKLSRAVQQTAQDAGTIHLVIDASAIEAGGRTATNSVEKLLRRTAKLQDRGLVRVETLATAVMRLSNRPAATPQRSILRAA
jgi:hypothetical protein